jgi:hypothetical protein
MIELTANRSAERGEGRDSSCSVGVGKDESGTADDVGDGVGGCFVFGREFSRCGVKSDNTPHGYEEKKSRCVAGDGGDKYGGRPDSIDLEWDDAIDDGE